TPSSPRRSAPRRARRGGRPRPAARRRPPGARPPPRRCASAARGAPASGHNGGASSRSCRPACRRSSQSAGPPHWPRRSAKPGRCSHSAAGRRCCPWDPRLSWSRSGRRCPACRTDRRHVLLRYRSLEKPYTERGWRSAPAPPLRPAGRAPTGLEALVKILVLASKHVRELLTYRECADVMREALAGLARGQIQQPLRTVVRPRDAAGFMGLMPSYSPEAGYGLKALVITPGNPAIGKDAHQGGVLLSDVQTGEPLALINASAITEVRTAAVSAVATDLLARPEAAELAVVGTGVQGRAHAHAIAATRPLTGIRLVARDLAKTRKVA